MGLFEKLTERAIKNRQRIVLPEGTEPRTLTAADRIIAERIADVILIGDPTDILAMAKDLKLENINKAQIVNPADEKVIDKYPTSAVCLFKLVNLPKINEKVSRKTGNEVITQVSKFIKENLSEEYFFVRYSGPKFAIVFSGSDVEGVAQFMQDIKAKVEQLKIESQEDYIVKPNTKRIPYVVPKLNVVITTYYKGTALEGVTAKLEEYLDSVDQNESDINYI